MKKPLKLFLFILLFLSISFQFAFCTEQKPASKSDKSPFTLDQILTKVEKNYSGAEFTTSFDQESTLKAMQITDTANGKAFFKHPNMMRWEYEKPTVQLIITDGKTLWVYKPEENQVMLGESPTFFGDGKGASFLTDIKSIRKKFEVSINAYDPEVGVTLKLIPQKSDLDLSYILLTVSTKTFHITQISTYNSYEDETKITFKDIKFLNKTDNQMFNFKIPKNADILTYDE